MPPSQDPFVTLLASDLHGLIPVLSVIISAIFCPLETIEPTLRAIVKVLILSMEQHTAVLTRMYSFHL